LAFFPSPNYVYAPRGPAGRLRSICGARLTWQTFGYPEAGLPDKGVDRKEAPG